MPNLNHFRDFTYVVGIDCYQSAILRLKNTRY